MCSCLECRHELRRGQAGRQGGAGRECRQAAAGWEGSGGRPGQVVGLDLWLSGQGGRRARVMIDLE